MERDKTQINRLVMSASSVLARPLDSTEEVGEWTMSAELMSFMDNTSHP